MNKKQVNGWLKQLDKRIAGIEKERDQLDELISKMQDLEEDCTEAIDSLVRARDALSKFV